MGGGSHDTIRATVHEHLATSHLGEFNRQNRQNRPPTGAADDQSTSSFSATNGSAPSSSSPGGGHGNGNSNADSSTASSGSSAGDIGGSGGGSTMVPGEALEMAMETVSVNNLEKAQRHLSKGLKVLQAMYHETAAEEPQGGESGEAEAHLEMLTSLKHHEVSGCMGSRVHGFMGSK